MHWIKANTVGKNIEMRYDHTMNFNDILGLLVIYGGRNDIKFMDDLHILKVRNLTWM